MSAQISRIQNHVQDRDSIAWKELCAYVDRIAEEGADEFTPVEYLGKELFAKIHTLPETISKLTKVTKISLYGSNLMRIPPEIGKMQALEYFDPYTSYHLHWFPYEITHCIRLKQSRVSTRVLYGNYKNRMGFPDLTGAPVRYDGSTVNCSICEKSLTYAQVDQRWISLRVGTDVLPLLVNLCSEACTQGLPKPYHGYIQHAHKGGADLEQPDSDEWDGGSVEVEPLKETESEPRVPFSELRVLKLIRKIWER